MVNKITTLSKVFEQSTTTTTVNEEEYNLLRRSADSISTVPFSSVIDVLKKLSVSTLLRYACIFHQSKVFTNHI